MARRLARWLRLWFRLSDPVDRRTYFGHGLALRVHAPHLDGYFRTRRGEFRLGYELEMAPQIYWKTLADAIVSRIHLRVLAHVKTLAERR